MALCALAMSVVAAACGGGDGQAAQDVIDTAFSSPVESADASLSVDLELEGGEEAQGPVRAQLSGPFRSGGSEQIPSFDLDVALQSGETNAPPLGLVSTGDNVFVEVQGVAYELGRQAVARQNRLLARRSEDAPGLAALGVDPSAWIVDAEVQGDAEVAGVSTTHVSASIDVPALIADLNGAAAQAGPAAQAPSLSEEEQAQLADAIADPSFDLFVGKDDGKIRRLTANLGFEVPEDGRDDAGGLSGGTVSLSLELANIDGDQEISAPEDARPLSELASQIQGLGGLLGGGDAPAPEGSAGTPAPEGDADTAAPEGGDSEGGSGDGGPSADAFQQYGECLQQADPSDQEALQACSELLAP